MSQYAFADPVYLGCGRLYPEHPDSMAWDDPEVHRYLIDCLVEQYPDGWVLCMSSPSLLTLAPMLPPGTHLCAWMKSFASFKPNVNPGYTWEPVALWGGRSQRSRQEATVRDHLVCPIMIQAGLTGAKPPQFCRWVLDLLGFVRGDRVHDLFPGTGIMGQVVSQAQDAERYHAASLFGSWMHDPPPDTKPC